MATTPQNTFRAGMPTLLRPDVPIFGFAKLRKHLPEIVVSVIAYIGDETSTKKRGQTRYWILQRATDLGVPCVRADSVFWLGLM